MRVDMETFLQITNHTAEKAHKTSSERSTEFRESLRRTLVATVHQGL